MHSWLKSHEIRMFAGEIIENHHFSYPKSEDVPQTCPTTHPSLRSLCHTSKVRPGIFICPRPSSRALQMPMLKSKPRPGSEIWEIHLHNKQILDEIVKTIDIHRKFSCKTSDLRTMVMVSIHTISCQPHHHVKFYPSSSSLEVIQL